MSLEHDSINQRPADERPELEGSEVMAAVSHELNTPLTVIAGYAELLAVRDDDHMRREAAAHIQEAVEALRSAIEDTLLAYRGEAGELGHRFLALRRESRAKRSTPS